LEAQSLCVQLVEEDVDLVGEVGYVLHHAAQ
jgi:hypothetical protein